MTPPETMQNTLTIVALLSLLFIGCGSTTVSRYGDAKVTRTDRLTAFDLKTAAKVTYDLEFPPISLAQPGSTTLAVRGIKPGMLPQDITLHYSEPHSLSQRDLSDQWGSAKFLLRIISKNSNATFRHTFVLAEWDWDFSAAISGRAHFTEPLNGWPLNEKFKPELWSGVTDYDIEITVLEPTESGTHHVTFSGFFPVFFEDEAMISRTNQAEKIAYSPNKQ
jgi:hypothetical protein